MKILITGVAGFIGYSLCKDLITKGHEIIGIDNLNDYYDVNLKLKRLSLLGISCTDIRKGQLISSESHPLFLFVQTDLSDKNATENIFAHYHFDVVCNLAAQAGVRYSIKAPDTYIQSNIIGFMNILEACRFHQTGHLIFASSSSIYGKNVHTPYSESDQTDSPASLYAATKKSDEVLAYAYSSLYKIPISGLRFFTVYGPWGRPDMAPFLFMDAMMHDRPIQVFNHGMMKRDFTYIDDIVAGIEVVMQHPSHSNVPYDIYNIGSSNPIELMNFIHTIEDVTGKEAQCHYEAMQPGDVNTTYADITKIEKFGFHPQTSIKEGIKKLYEWYRTEVYDIRNCVKDKSSVYQSDILSY